MIRMIVLLFLMCGVTFSQPNYSGYKDTAIVADFQGTGTGVTKAFGFQYENVRVSAMADDTVEAGYDSDSIQFQWGIQVGNVVINTSNKRDTTWQEKFVVDTFDILTAANLVAPVSLIDTIGATNIHTLFIDTTNVTGNAVQDVLIAYPIAPVVRFWYLGLAGNRVSSSYIELVFSITGIGKEL